MLSNFKKILLTTRTFSSYRTPFLKILFLMILVSLTESLGITMFLPVIQNIISGDMSEHFSFLKLITTDTSILIVILVCMMLAISIVKLFLKTKLMKDTTILTWGIKEKWSSEIYQKVICGSYQFVTSKKQGELLNKMSSQPLIACVTLEHLMRFYSLFFMIVTYIIFMFAINFYVTFTVIIFAILYYAVASKFTTKKAAQFSVERYELYKKIDESIAETISMIKQVKVFSMEKNLVQDFNELNKSVTKAQVKFSVISAVSENFVELFIVILILIVFSLNSLFRLFDLKDIMPLLIVFGLFGLRTMMHASTLIATQMKILSNSESLKSVTEILDELEAYRSAEMIGDKKFEKINTDIVIKDLKFKFERSSNIIDYGNFIIKKGQYTAIVGESGSGKSTFVDILMRFYEPYSGTITINNTNLQHIDPIAWRNMIGYVSQEPELFNDSIINNIMVANPLAKQEKVEEICKKCHIHDFIISLDNGYNTKIGDRGVMLSGGQKQRIAIARALIRNPEIIIFDEATSALDDDTENVIKNTIEEIREDRIIIAIAHRKTTIESADVVLDFSKFVKSKPVV